MRGRNSQAEPTIAIQDRVFVHRPYNRQISDTLTQLPTVRQVCIAVNGRTAGCAGILQR